MLRAIIVSPEAEVAERFSKAVAETGQIGVVRKLDRYPDSHELARILRAHAPHVAFVSIAALKQAIELSQLAEQAAPGIQCVAIHGSCEPSILLELMRAGIREFLAVPFHRQELTDLISRLREAAGKKPPTFSSTDLVFAFLPSKAGVGTSTTALNVGMALSRLPDTKTLLLDLDLNCGMQRFMLKLENAYSIVDACEHAANMDEELWPQLVTSIKQLDVLHSGGMNPGVRLETFQIRNLIDFTRRHYRTIIVDLSGNMERYSLEVMHEAKRVFIVTTPEIPALHLAREKLTFLQGLDLGDRVSVLLNRVHKRSVITPAQVEELLGVPMALCLPNDYHGVHRALTAAHAVEAGSELGKQYMALARTMVDIKQPQPAPRKRLVEYFSIAPARYTLMDGKKPAG